MITLDGDLIETSGAMIGGFRRKTGNIFENKDISNQIENSNNELENLKSSLTKHVAAL